MEAVIINDGEIQGPEASLDLDRIRIRAGITLFAISAVAFIMVASTSGFFFYHAKKCDEAAKDEGIIAGILLALESAFSTIMGFIFGILAILPLVFALAWRRVIYGEKYHSCRGNAFGFSTFLGLMVYFWVVGFLITAGGPYWPGMIISVIMMICYTLMMAFTIRSRQDIKLSRETFEGEFGPHEDNIQTGPCEYVEDLPRFRVVHRS